jgi:hypothetical protein
MGVAREFLYRLQDHYLWLLGLILMTEPLLDALWSGYRRTADRYVSRKIRTRISWTVVVACAFIACFLAFQDQYAATLKARNEIATVKGERDEARHQRDANISPTLNRLSGDLTAARGQIDAQKQQIAEQQAELARLRATYAHRRLTAQQKQAIVQIIKQTGEKYSFAVFQPNDCDDCNEYSSDFIETLTAPLVGWKVSLFTTMVGGVNPHFRGIALLVNDPKKPSRAALVLATALSAAKIKFEGAAAKGFQVPKDGVGLLIGPKKGQ